MAQISGALALLAVAGLFVRTLSSAEHMDLGFDAEHLITVHGLREFAFVGDTAGSDQQARFQGFQSALAAAGLAVVYSTRTTWKVVVAPSIPAIPLIPSLRVYVPSSRS